MNKNPPISEIIGIGFLVMAGLYFILVTSPFFFRLPSAGLDASWAWGVEELRRKGFQFGEEIVFTYGPYIGLATHNYSEQHYSSNLLIGSIISGSYVLHFLFLTKSKNIWLTILSVAFLGSTLAIAMDPIFMSFPLVLLLATIKLTQEESLSKWKNWMAFLGGATIGIMPLIKVSFSAICLAGLLMLFSFLAIKREWKMAGISGLSAISSFLFFWIISGQDPSSIGNYLVNSSQMITGYSDGMASYGSTKQIALYLLASAALIGAYYFSLPKKEEAWPTILLLGAFLFLSFKAAFVRHDYGHLISAYASLWLLAIIFFYTSTSYKTSIIIFFFILATSAAIPPGKIYTIPKNTINMARDIPAIFSAHLNKIPQKHYEISKQNVRQEFPTPTLNGTVDIYSYEQARLIASGNSWNPRPIFQSYTVLTPALAEMNRQHLLHDNAPDNILFKLQPIDNRFPTLEDGPSLPLILKKYHAINFSDGLIHFVKNKNSSLATDFSRMPQSTLNAYLGSEIILPWENGMIFIEIETQHSLAGKMMSFLYKTGGLQMKLHLDDGTYRNFRLTKKMATAGFIVSPLIENSEDFWRVAKNEMAEEKRITNFSITPETQSLWWKPEIKVLFKRIE